MGRSFVPDLSNATTWLELHWTAVAYLLLILRKLYDGTITQAKTGRGFRLFMAHLLHEVRTDLSVDHLRRHVDMLVQAVRNPDVWQLLIASVRRSQEDRALEFSTEDETIVTEFLRDRFVPSKFAEALALEAATTCEGDLSSGTNDNEINHATKSTFTTTSPTMRCKNSSYPLPLSSRRGDGSFDVCDALQSESGSAETANEFAVVSSPCLNFELVERSPIELCDLQRAMQDAVYLLPFNIQREISEQLLNKDADQRAFEAMMKDMEIRMVAGLHSTVLCFRVMTEHKSNWRDWLKGIITAISGGRNNKVTPMEKSYPVREEWVTTFRELVPAVSHYTPEAEQHLMGDQLNPTEVDLELPHSQWPAKKDRQAYELHVFEEAVAKTPNFVKVSKEKAPNKHRRYRVHVGPRYRIRGLRCREVQERCTAANWHKLYGPKLAPVVREEAAAADNDEPTSDEEHIDPDLAALLCEPSTSAAPQPRSSARITKQPTPGVDRTDEATSDAMDRVALGVIATLREAGVPLEEIQRLMEQYVEAPRRAD